VDRYPKMFAEIVEHAKKIKGLKWKNIIDLSFKGHALTKLPWMETKYLLSAPTKNPNVIWLLKDKIAITNWAENEPVIFVSQNKYIVQSYNDYFNELWNSK
ncbi:MAG: hypothetical protein PHD51_04395, partial [Patescibacteria group bacterium]|nr:hypothetical protein [Patescibacteria group bacterium]